MRGKAVCSIHGGKSPSGLAHPSTKHGRHSKDLPTRLAGRYEVAASDPDLLRLDSELHLIDALMNDRLAVLDTGESGRLWNELGSEWESLEAAQRAKDQAGTVASAQRIKSLIKRGQADHGARTEILDMIERRRKLVDSEGKRRVQAQQVMTTEQATLLVSVVATSVQRHVSNPAERAAIARDIAAVFGAGHDGDHQSGEHH